MSLTAKFSMRVAKVRQDGKTVEGPVEWVEISGFPAGDVVSRRARDADRQRFKAAYAEFRPVQAPRVTSEQLMPPAEDVPKKGRGLFTRK